MLTIQSDCRVSNTDHYGIHALDFCNLSGYEQLVHDLKHVHGIRLYHVMTNILDVIEVSTGSLLGSTLFYKLQII